MPLGSLTTTHGDVGLGGERQRFVRCARQSVTIEVSDDYPNSLTFQHLVGVANTVVADNGQAGGEVFGNLSGRGRNLRKRRLAERDAEPRAPQKSRHFGGGHTRNLKIVVT